MYTWFNTVFMILIAYNMYVDSTGVIKLDKNNSHELCTKADRIILSCVYLVFIVGLLFVWLTNSQFGNIILQIISFAILLLLLLNMMLSIKILGPIISGKAGLRDLTYRERLNFNLLAYGLVIIFSIFLPISKLFSIIDIKINSTLMKCVIVSLVEIVLSFLTTFIFLTNLIRPLKHFWELYKKIDSKVNSFFESIRNYFGDIALKPTIKARLTNQAVTNLFQSGYSWNATLIIIIVFVMDFIINLFFVLYAYTLCFFLAMLANLFLCFSTSLSKLLSMVTNIPGSRIMKNTFRISMIVAIFSLVICNRMHIFYLMNDSFMEVTEFFSSSIILPIIFEWIYSNKSENRNN